MLAIAHHAGGQWPQDARKAAERLSQTLNALRKPNITIELLAAMRNLFAAHGRVLTSKQVQKELVADPLEPWCEYHKGRPITERQIAILLKQIDIGLRPRTVHPTGRPTPSGKGYRLQWFTDAFARYLPPEKPRDKK